MHFHLTLKNIFANPRREWNFKSCRELKLRFLYAFSFQVPRFHFGSSRSYMQFKFITIIQRESMSWRALVGHEKEFFFSSKFIVCSKQLSGLRDRENEQKESEAVARCVFLCEIKEKFIVELCLFYCFEEHLFKRYSWIEGWVRSLHPRDSKKWASKDGWWAFFSPLRSVLYTFHFRAHNFIASKELLCVHVIVQIYRISISIVFSTFSGSSPSFNRLSFFFHALFAAQTFFSLISLLKKNELFMTDKKSLHKMQ
jgi:hypothetical protein